MSAVASLTLIPRSSVSELARSARTSSSSLRSYLAEHGRELHETYDWSGYCMLHVLSYLEDRDVDLEQSEFDVESAAVNNVHDLTVFITPAHKRFLDQLGADPDARVRHTGIRSGDSSLCGPESRPCRTRWCWCRPGRARRGWRYRW